MPTSYSIADARHNLAAIVHELDHEPAIRLTRRGQPVAVLLSMSEYARMQSGSVAFGSAYATFRAAVDLAALDIDPALFAAARDHSSGREMNW